MQSVSVFVRTFGTMLIDVVNQGLLMLARCTATR